MFAERNPTQFNLFTNHSSKY